MKYNQLEGKKEAAFVIPQCNADGSAGQTMTLDSLALSAKIQWSLEACREENMSAVELPPE